MAHIAHNKPKLLARTRRIRGQVLALERAIEDGSNCTAVLTQIAAVKGAVQGLMIEVLDDHLREHVTAQDDPRLRDDEISAVMKILKSYFR